MAENDHIFTAIGELTAEVRNVKENTDKIPDIATGLALVKSDMDNIKPKVEKHQKVMWVGVGVMGVFSAAWTFILAVIEGGRH